MFPNEFIVAKVSTTGFVKDPSKLKDGEKSERIVELALVHVKDGQIQPEHFHSYYNPERSVSPEAVSMHGMTHKSLSSQPLFSQHAERIKNFLGDRLLVLHHAHFERLALQIEFDLHATTLAEKSEEAIVPFNFKTQPFIDLMSASKKQTSGRSGHDKDSLYARYDIQYPVRFSATRGALKDAYMLAALCLKMYGAPKARAYMDETASLRLEAFAKMKTSVKLEAVPDEKTTRDMGMQTDRTWAAKECKGPWKMSTLLKKHGRFRTEDAEGVLKRVLSSEEELPADGLTLLANTALAST